LNGKVNSASGFNENSIERLGKNYELVRFIENAEKVFYLIFWRWDFKLPIYL
jgi:hypothetical protein